MVNPVAGGNTFLIGLFALRFVVVVSIGFVEALKYRLLYPCAGMTRSV